MSFIAMRTRTVEKNVVKVGMREGLFENIKFYFDRNTYVKNLDYEEFSFL